MPRRPLPLGAWPPPRPWWRQPTEILWLPVHAAAEAVNTWERLGLPTPHTIRNRRKARP